MIRARGFLQESGTEPNSLLSRFSPERAINLESLGLDSDHPFFAGRPLIVTSEFV